MANNHKNLPKEFFAKTGVSRETGENFTIYADLLQRWQRKINLIGPSTIENIWQRHFFDSAQLIDYLPKNYGLSGGLVYDIGSGAGFPGLVLSIMGVKNITLIDSDRKKCLFLSEVIRQTACDAKVIQARLPNDAKKLLLPKAKIIFARGLAPLPKMLDIVFPVISVSTCCILLKGASVNNEILAARDNWKFDLTVFSSRTSKGGKIISLSGVSQNGTGCK